MWPNAIVLSGRDLPLKSGRGKWMTIGLIAVAVVILVANLTANDGGDIRETFEEISEGLNAEGEASCPALSAAETEQLVDSWTGNGELTVEATAKTETDGSDLFSEIWYLQGSAPGIGSQVFAFATDPGGLLVGAESVTREFFEWGADIGPGSTADQEARAALAAAPDCLG